MANAARMLYRVCSALIEPQRHAIPALLAITAAHNSCSGGRSASAVVVILSSRRFVSLPPIVHPPVFDNHK